MSVEKRSSAGVRLNQSKQKGEQACAQSEAECDTQYDGQQEKEEVHGGGGSFREVWGDLAFAPPSALLASPGRLSRGII